MWRYFRCGELLSIWRKMTNMMYAWAALWCSRTLGCSTQIFQDSVSQITAPTALGSSRLPKSHRHQHKLKHHHGHFDDDKDNWWWWIRWIGKGFILNLQMNLCPHSIMENVTFPQLSFSHKIQIIIFQVYILCLCPNAGTTPCWTSSIKYPV